MPNLSGEPVDRSDTPFFVEHFALPSARLIEHLVSKLYALVWRYTAKSYSFSDKMVFIKVLLRMFADVINICTETSDSMSFLIHYILFLARCVHYSPQDMILVCRSERVWKLLLLVGGISYTRSAFSSY